jgi:hypothetical protein
MDIDPIAFSTSARVDLTGVESAPNTYYEEAVLFYEFAHQATGDIRVRPGRTIHRLRRVDGRLRIAAKRVDLVNAAGPIPNLTFLI